MSYGIHVVADPDVEALSNHLVFESREEAEEYGHIVECRFCICYKSWKVFPIEPIRRKSWLNYFWFWRSC